MNDGVGYLVERATGKVVKTKFRKLRGSDAKRLVEAGWSFDWTRVDPRTCEAYALLTVDGGEIQGVIALADDPANNAIYVDLVESAPHNIGSRGRYQGVGAHLFAYAGLLCFERGYDALYFDAKTNLIDYYSRRMGASRLGGSSRMIIERDALRALVDHCYGGDDREG